MPGGQCSVLIVLALTRTVIDSPAPGLPREANLPRITESNVHPILASREQDLSGELQRIRADLHSIGRMVSIRLEPDSD